MKRPEAAVILALILTALSVTACGMGEDAVWLWRGTIEMKQEKDGSLSPSYPGATVYWQRGIAGQQEPVSRAECERKKQEVIQDHLASRSLASGYKAPEFISPDGVKVVDVLKHVTFTRYVCAKVVLDAGRTAWRPGETIPEGVAPYSTDPWK